jgi:tRNA(Ile2) C34 agmatinyltransferase TiaS
MTTAENTGGNRGRDVVAGTTAQASEVISPFIVERMLDDVNRLEATYRRLAGLLDMPVRCPFCGGATEPLHGADEGGARCLKCGSTGDMDVAAWKAKHGKRRM